MAVSDLFKKLMLVDDDYILVASIDFGTTFSGYACSFKASKNDIIMNKSWGVGSSCETHKVLLGKDGHFLAFGYEAESQYNQMLLTEGPGSCELYRHFKMRLHNEEHLSRSTQVESVSGKKAKAIDIFTHAVRYLCQHLIKAITKTVKTPPQNSHIRWVLTVPAIWNDKSKLFMREVALKAGMISDINSKKFLICLEPEAASIYCRQLDTDAFQRTDPSGEKLLRKSGTKFVIIDAGGGTIDITSHQVCANGTVKELVAASGGPWGGTEVDQNFIQFLKKLLGADFISKFQSLFPADWLKLRVEFEAMKKRFNPNDTESKIFFHLSYNLFKAYNDVSGGDLAKRLSDTKLQGMRYENGALILQHSLLMNIFQPVITTIVAHIKKEMRSPALRNVNLILLVGGFGECQFLQDELIKAFSPTIPVLCPADAGISIIKGAVLFGHTPEVITSRIARRTYGMSIYEQFDLNLHDDHRLVNKECGPQCWIFRTFVKKGERVAVGEERTYRLCPISSTQQTGKINLLSVDVEIVKYPDNPTQKVIGDITVPLPDISRGLDRAIEAKLYFGATELQFEACEVTGGIEGKKVKTTVDFLAN